MVEPNLASSFNYRCAIQTETVDMASRLKLQESSQYLPSSVWLKPRWETRNKQYTVTWDKPPVLFTSHPYVLDKCKCSLIPNDALRQRVWYADKPAECSKNCRNFSGICAVWEWTSTRIFASLKRMQKMEHATKMMKNKWLQYEQKLAFHARNQTHCFMRMHDGLIFRSAECGWETMIKSIHWKSTLSSKERFIRKLWSGIHQNNRTHLQCWASYLEKVMNY